MRFLLLLTGVLMSSGALAAEPAEGSLTIDELSLEYSGGPFVNANVIHQSDSGASGPTCLPPALQCDEFGLTLDFPQDIEQVYPSAQVRVTWGWEDISGVGLVDFDCWVYDGEGTLLETSGAGSNNPEAAAFLLYGGVSEYVLTCAPYFAAGDSYTGRVEVVLGDPVEIENEEGDTAGSGALAAVLVPQSDSSDADSRSAESNAGAGSLSWFLPWIGLLLGLRRRI